MIKIPQKPKTQKGQMDTLWDIVCNHLLHEVSMNKTISKFMMGFQALILALLAVVLAILFGAVV